MANKKITELTELTTPAGADLFAIVDDTDTTTKKVTVSNLMTQAPVQTADISGFATTVSLGNHESLTSSVHGISAFGATLVDDADAAAARTTLGMPYISSGTDTNLPSSPATGDVYLETNTGKLRWWDGTYWNTFNYDSQYDPNYAANQLGYSGGLFTSTNYNISTQPIMHFDAAILDGSDQANNPSSGSAVSTWGDRSGQATNYDATQATGSAQPTFNVSGDDKYVTFDGGDFLDFADYTLPTAFNMVIVGNTQADANNFLPIGMNTDSQYVILEIGGTVYGIAGSVVDNTYGPNYNSIQQFWATRDGSNNHNIYVQGGNSIISVAAAASRTVSRLGKANNNYYHTGDIYEVIIWGADLSTTDKNTVNSYLANKYSSLPTLTSFS
jgi:hypothetical protein